MVCWGINVLGISGSQAGVRALNNIVLARTTSNILVRIHQFLIYKHELALCLYISSDSLNIGFELKGLMQCLKLTYLKPLETTFLVLGTKKTKKTRKASYEIKKKIK